MNINEELVIVDLKNGIAEFDLSYNIDQKGIDWVSEELASNPYFAGMHAGHVEEGLHGCSGRNNTATCRIISS